MPKNYEHAVCGISQIELPRRMKKAIQAAQRTLPDGAGVTVFVFDLGPGGGIGYASNSVRSDMVRAIREWLDKVDPNGGPQS